jgi:hypothetical protein
MVDKEAVELADRASRGQAFLWAGLAVIFLALQLVASPWFGSPSAHAAKSWSWLLLTLLILANLATGGGLGLSRRIRALLNDAVAAAHRARALEGGFWAAIAVALGLYIVRRGPDGPDGPLPRGHVEPRRRAGRLRDPGAARAPRCMSG